MNINIRKAELCDLEQIENIERTLHHRILTYNTLSSSLNINTYYYLVATIDNKIVGYIAAELLVDHFDILAIAVLEKYRKQHIATMLLNTFFNIAINLNIKEIFLEVRCSNIGAINFYEKSGFEKISSRKNYYTDTNETAYIYKKMV